MLESWGRYPKASQQAIPVNWRSDPLPRFRRPLLAYGQGRSYGDCCLNDGGTLLVTSGLDRFISFDGANGVVRCEAGTTLGDVLALAVPRGFFVPVLPGTRFVTVGGAIANDIHGKNHARAGSFGRHVRRIELLRSTGERVECRPGDPLFAATVGGLGLTGLITWAELQLRPIRGPFIAQEAIPFADLDAFFAVDAASARTEYTVAWIDGLSQRTRGIYYRGDHSERPGPPPPLRAPLGLPFDFPELALAPWSVRVFNAMTAAKGRLLGRRREVPYPRFFFPLDGLGGWNRIYGKRGLLQFQCVVPDAEGARAVLARVRASRQSSFLAVIKTFGDLPSPGMLSFPRKGVTLALDFRNQGAPTVQLFSELEDVVRERDGALYPAKDALMSPEAFEQSFPRLAEFLPHVDPGFSSSFWRRVARA